MEQNLQTIASSDRLRAADGKTNFEILVYAGIKTKMRTYIKATTPSKKVELRCSCLYFFLKKKQDLADADFF